MKKCNKCNTSKGLKEFEDNRKTCKACRRELRKIHSINCKHCKKLFKTAKKKSQYCSSECAGKARIEIIEVNCTYCGNPKSITPSLKEIIENQWRRC